MSKGTMAKRWTCIALPSARNRSAIPRWSSTSMVRECRPPEREPSTSWLARRSTIATSTPANASSPANISPVGPPPAITTARSLITACIVSTSEVLAGSPPARVILLLAGDVGLEARRLNSAEGTKLGNASDDSKVPWAAAAGAPAARCLRGGLRPGTGSSNPGAAKPLVPTGAASTGELGGRSGQPNG
jgi:hypothetical protein